MKTTLKRGIGRAAGADGNGNGNGHASEPPLLGPIVRYRQPEPPRRSFTATAMRWLGWLVVVLAVVAAGIGGGAYLYYHESVKSITATDPSIVRATKNGELKAIADPSKPAIALVAGYDKRAGIGGNSYAGTNSDTLMLLRADPANDTLSLLSFPRDLWVNIYCHGNTVYTQNRINSAWQICGSNGPAAVLDTMEHLTGLRNINYLITLDFHGFKQIVNHLHGVYMNVDRRYFNPPGTGWSAINLQPGYQKLDGGQALQYVRYRHTDSDIYRTGRQQLFLDALKLRLKQTFSLTEIPGLIGALKGNLAIGRGGGGSPSLGELKSYGKLLQHLPPGHLFRNAIPLQDFTYPFINGASVTEAPQSAISAAVQSFLHPDLSQGQRASDRVLGIKEHVKAKARLKPDQVSVLVLNAGNVPGRAANTSYELTQRGFQAKQLPSTVPANAPKVRSASLVYYDPVQPNAKVAATEVASLLGPNTKVAAMTPAIAGYAQQAGNPLVVAAVGTSFSGTLTPPPAKAKIPPKQKPQVSPGLPVTLAALKRVARRVPFPVLAPHEVAQGAQLSTQEGVRVFRPLQHRRTLCLTFTMPNGLSYWQIQETNWNSAPILQNPTKVLHGHGRELDLYTTGGQITLAVVRFKSATYWVVNTILNELSNSTMLAIARSLRPIHK
jgi:LCP family protein required for cell wall assembly